MLSQILFMGQRHNQNVLSPNGYALLSTGQDSLLNNYIHVNMGADARLYYIYTAEEASLGCASRCALQNVLSPNG